MVKSIKIQDGTHKRLSARKVEWGKKTLDLTIEELLARDDGNASPRNATTGTEKGARTKKGNTTPLN